MQLKRAFQSGNRSSDTWTQSPSAVGELVKNRILRFFRSAAESDTIINLLCQSQLALEGEHESDDASGDSHVQREDFHPMEHVPERGNFGSCTVDARERILTSHELGHNTSCAYGLRYIGNSGGYARMIGRDDPPNRAPSRID
ncbi:hypothetical protein U1Q18_039312 [Sarracenia purpurea var. burkii]